jgi:hypothetical protein
MSARRLSLLASFALLAIASPARAQHAGHVTAAAPAVDPHAAHAAHAAPK